MTCLIEPPDNPTFREIIGGELNQHPIAEQNFNIMDSDPTGDMGQYFVTILKPNLKHRIRQDLLDNTSGLDYLFSQEQRPKVGYSPRIIGTILSKQIYSRQSNQTRAQKSILAEREARPGF